MDVKEAFNGRHKKDGKKGGVKREKGGRREFEVINPLISQKTVPRQYSSIKGVTTTNYSNSWAAYWLFLAHLAHENIEMVHNYIVYNLTW